MVVVLPSEYIGGVFNVSQDDDEILIDTSKNSLLRTSVIAWLEGTALEIACGLSSQLCFF
jgi:hypothetical protein